MQAAQDATNEIWGTPRLHQPSFLRKRLRSLATIGVIALTLATGGASSQLISYFPDLTGVGPAVAFVLSAALNTGAFLLAFQLLGVDHHRWRDLLPGSILAAVGYVTLQLVGQWYVKRTISGAGDTYGSFAVVIGLLGWLYLLGQLVVLSMEVNAVLAQHLSPRSLRKDEPTEADEQIVRIAARSAQVRVGTRILVDFGGPDDEHHPIEAADPDD
jgi:YihY family inner membrane protein